ncbi:TIGR03758 family integrating conjugative element protein [Pseudomonas aeruginosa]
MSMSGAQTSAFQAAAGFPPSAGEGLFIGAAMTFLLLWSAWAMYSTWRGWATNNLDSATAGVPKASSRRVASSKSALRAPASRASARVAATWPKYMSR